MSRSATNLKRIITAVAAVSVTATILVSSASAFWLGGGLQYGTTPTTTTVNQQKTQTKAVEGFAGYVKG